MLELHDSLLTKYEVDFKQKIIFLEVEKGEKNKKVVFSEGYDQGTTDPFI